MPKRSRSSSSRSSKRSRKSARYAAILSRRSRFPRGMRMSRSHSFHRWVTGIPSGNVGVTYCTYDPTTSVITCTATNTTAEFSLQFPFSALPNVSEFTSLFDAYMITKVIVQIKMTHNPNAIAQALPGGNTFQNNNFYPTIWYTPDYDDANTVSLAAIKEFERVKHKVIYPNREINIVLRPKPVTQIYRTATTTGYQVNNKAMWLDAAQTDIPHFGFKSVIDFEGVTTTTPGYQFKVNCKYYFKCKSAR